MLKWFGNEVFIGSIGLTGEPTPIFVCRIMPFNHLESVMIGLLRTPSECHAHSESKHVTAPV